MAYPAGELIQYISEQASNEGQAWGRKFCDRWSDALGGIIRGYPMLPIIPLKTHNEVRLPSRCL